MKRGPICVVVLAGGTSTRFGDDPPKQLVQIGGLPQVRRIVGIAIAAEIGPVVVVTGHRYQAVSAALRPLEFHWVHNPTFRFGQSTSVRAGLEKADETGAVAVLFVPCDMPFLDCRTLRNLAAAYRRGSHKIVAASHRGQPRAPVLWDESLFDDLLRIHDDQGGRQLFARHRDEICKIEVPDGRILADFNTRKELAALLRR